MGKNKRAKSGVQHPPAAANTAIGDTEMEQEAQEGGDKSNISVMLGPDVLASTAGDLGQSHDSNNLIIIPKEGTAKQRQRAKMQAKMKQQQEAQPQLSRAAQRKLRQVQQKAERRALVEQALTVLQGNSLQTEQLQLLQPIHSRGGTMTKKEKLKQAWRRQQAGLPVEASSGLLQRRKEREDSSDSDASSDDDSPAAAVKPTVTAGQPLHTPVPKAVAGTREMDIDDNDDDGGEAVPDGPAAKRVKLTQDSHDTGPSEQLKKKQKKLGSRQVPAAVPHVPTSRKVVQVNRTPEVVEARSKLPIIDMEQEVMEAVAENDVILICGETGCGKTTQVPQFLYEAGYGSADFPETSGRIGVTQPRRVAAVSTAERLAVELNSPLGDVVGYQIRHDKAVGGRTAVKFMTDGILLAEMRQDLLLRSYSVVVVDEAHERSLNTDLLIGLLSRAVPLRRQLYNQWKKNPTGTPVYPLKLIIMSATLQAQDFQNNPKLFAQPPPIVKVPGRQFPVVVHFAKRTELQDFVGAAVRKVMAIHNTLPPGGVLVFLTGAREVEQACRTLRRQLDTRRKEEKSDVSQPEASPPAESAEREEQWAGTMSLSGADELEAALEGAGVEKDLDELMYEEDDEDMDEEEEDVWVVNQDGSHQTLNRLQLQQHEASITGAITQQQNGQLAQDPSGVAAASSTQLAAKDGKDASMTGDQQATAGGTSSAATTDAKNPAGVSKPTAGAHPILKPRILPLYAMLSRDQQAKVFEAVPEGERLIVVATNVAETSLTISGIRYVVDAGRAKVKLISPGGATHYDVSWISKASAQQRTGRAGRTMAGHCYRLFSSAHYHHNFPEYSSPEIVNTPLEDVILGMKSMSIEQVQNFPFPTTPDAVALQHAEQVLLTLGALSAPAPFRITTLGSHMAQLPISPRVSRMLLWLLQPQQASKLHARMGPYAVALAAAAGSESPFTATAQEETADQKEEDTTAATTTPNTPATTDNTTHTNHPPHSKPGKGKTTKDTAPPTSLNGAPSSSAPHHSLRTAESDLLNSMLALCAYMSAPNKIEFCVEYKLHARLLKEMEAVYVQLMETIVQQNKFGRLPLGEKVVEGLRSCLEKKGELGRPSPKVLTALRQGVAAGWPDQVAKRVKSEAYLHKLAGKGKNVAVRYVSCRRQGVEAEYVYLHPRSILAKSAPEFVVYGQLVATEKRTYMAEVTVVEATWLYQTGRSLCKLSPPLEDPPPRYKPDADSVMSWHDVTYGPHSWPLPRITAPHPESDGKAKYFAAAVVAGEVLQALADLKPFWALPPAMLLQPEMQNIARVQTLVSALKEANVDSAAKLAKRLTVQNNFLRHELELCLKKQHASSLKFVWPKLLAEAQAVVAAQPL